MSNNRFAKFERRKPGQRNKLEAAYEAHLGLLQKAGEIHGFMFEGMKLRMADNTFFTADFVVFASDWVIELHDTKGTTTKTLKDGAKVKGPWVEGDALVKLKVVAELFPFRVFSVYKVGNTWEKKQY